MKILIVEDEKRLSNILKLGLEHEKYLVEQAFDGEEAINKFTFVRYDLVILDIMIPKKDGIAVLGQIRSIDKSIPVIMLTAKISIEDRVLGLDLGADDYLTKPFSLEELLARMRALIRRNTSGDIVLQVRDLRLDPKSKTTTRADVEIELSNKEYLILEYLLRHKNEVVSADTLIQHVWPFDYDGFSNIVTVYIRHLRNKIEKPFAKSPKIIHTLRGRGYTIKDG